MRGIISIISLLLMSSYAYSQESIERIEDIDLASIEPNQIKKYWLKMIDDGMGQAIYIPLLIAKGKTTTPVLGLTAAIHGNELNGIPIIQKVFEHIDITNLEGSIIAVPGLNTFSIVNHQRKYIDGQDLNRIFPGKEQGNRSQQYVWQIKEKLLSQLDYLIDMHTASFGRENTLYVRADLQDTVIKKMAMLQDADIILCNAGTASTATQKTATRTMRAEAVLNNIPTITVEYANPQVYQADIIKRGTTGILNIMSWLNMTRTPIHKVEPAIICKKSYWIYIDQGGYLEVKPELNQVVEQNELIAILRNPFGDIIKQYYAPERGIVIGKSSNPINMSGGRILHLGIIDECE